MSAHLAELLSAAAEQSPDRVAMVEPVSGRRLTWSELDTAADGFAGGLSGLGMVAGYRIALALPNRVELVVAYLGALRAGLVVVPVNPRATTGDVVRLLVDCGARAVLADRTALATVRQAVAGLQDALVGAEDELRRSTAVPRVVALGAPTLPGETGYEELLALDGRRPPTAPDPERLATLLYTSGTSGRPRGAMLSHRALLANVEQVGALDPPMLTDTDVVLGVLPLFHVYGLNAVLGQVLARRARLVLVDGFDI
ncbi:MAG: class I adenylate-forming enzyme family protein, partial [Nocardioidaceae bacterium]